MTVNYSLDAATASAWAVIAVIFLWRGSLMKLVWREMLGWTILMAVLYAAFVWGLKGTEYENYYKTMFDLTKEVPMDGTLMFLMSYMTYNSLTRWSETFKCMAWPENVALIYRQYANKRAMKPGEARLMNQTIARYLAIFYILLFRDVCSDVREMFPTFDDMVQPGIMTADEANLLQSSRLDRNSPHYWIPIDWIVTLVKSKYQPTYVYNRKGQRVRNKKESIMTELEYLKFIGELNKFRGRLGDVLSYDWVPLPLALFQTLTVFVYSTLVVNCFQMQTRIITSGKSSVSEMFVECLSTLPFNMLHLAFLRISQVVINPFGSDDDDFETQYLIDRHIKVLNEILCPEETKKQK
uniref:Bestrophin homolog n=3 Tax=Caenorhabditis tropicalis TaxID=1561998 RepID=A0A1I7TQ49_9PELO